MKKILISLLIGVSLLVGCATNTVEVKELGTNKIEDIQEGDQTLYVECYEDVNKFFKDINEARDGAKEQLDYLKELKDTAYNHNPINKGEVMDKGEEFLILQEIWNNRPNIYTYNERLREVEFGVNDVINSISSVYYNLLNMKTDEDIEMLISAYDDAIDYFDNIADINFEKYVMK